ncbi:peptidase M22, glycoprotease [Piedraia hortae CBS 480.64]|uniref:N(6)-L-threonylcarbamoyladenine synthase n=1 Tax=Piedraia hortae CBS 480.64 TaxID=1314780 RepID=A0A6A7C7V0_9PEZI|nr:peptidase M22, glycoprotease [Piedraia hortae CBS 480.64]
MYRAASLLSRTSRRQITTLAIETSCDDTSVALLTNDKSTTEVHFHKTLTSDNSAYGGIHPLVAQSSHQRLLAPLIREASLLLPKLPPLDMVAATRGPGMYSNLSVGLSIAKGLAVAWNVPLIGVHHMQAHALTPRLAASLQNKPTPSFPFMTLLVSGGHTLLLDTKNTVDHFLIAETKDIAIGDCLDKCARAILPSEALKSTVPYGRALEEFSALNSESYKPPKSRSEEITPRESEWDWALPPPLKSNRRLEFSFSGLLSSVERIVFTSNEISLRERRHLACEVQRVAFEHLLSRILIRLEAGVDTPKALVVSGGVAANKVLKTVLRRGLDVRGYANVELVFPPMELCGDNALMIAWTAVEMWELGFVSELGIEPFRKWPLDGMVAGGGVLGVDGWIGR